MIKYIFPKDWPLSKTIFLLGLPIILSNLSRVIMTLCDTAMVGRLHIGALSAVGMGGLFVFIFTSIGVAMRTGTQAMVSRRLGENKLTRCGHVINNAIIIGISIMLPLTILIFFVSPYIIPYLFEIHQIAVIELCITYVQYSCLSILFTSLAFTMAGFFSGIEKTSYHIEATISSNILNVYLNAGLIFGSDQLFKILDEASLGWVFAFWSWIEFPELGVKGAAIATSISSAWLFFHYILRYIFLVYKSSYYHPFIFDKKIIIRLIKLCRPLATQLTTEMAGFVIFLKLVAHIGTIELDSSEIVFNVMHASFLPAAGLGQACATIVGKSLGEKNHNKAYNSIYETIRLSILFMGTTGLLFFLFPYYIMRFFTINEVVIEMGIPILKLLGLFQVIDAICQTLWFSLNGAGDTKFPAFTQMILMWTFFIPLCWVSVMFFNIGLIYLWSYFIIYLLIFTFILLIRFYRGSWVEIKI